MCIRDSINTKGANLPLSETFEGASYPPSGWSEFDDTNDAVKWELTSAASGFGVGAQSVYFNNWSQNATGRKDEIRMPRFNGESYNSITLTFDVAYWSYTNQSEQDTLQVLVSTDCGATFTQVYSKGGATLSTVAGNSTSAFTPTSTQWRTDTVNLNSYIGQSIILAFRNVARFGNNLYLDNISVNATVTANAGINKSICNGNSTTIGVAGTSGVNYSWTPATGLSSATISNPIASPTSTQQYILTATHPLSGIFGKDTVNVIVNPFLTYITNSAIPSSLCKNITVNIPFTVACAYTAGNIFTAQLSDAAGSFTNPVDIGSVTSTTFGSITATIPNSTPAGAGYRIRIVSSSPVRIGDDNLVDLHVNINRNWYLDADNDHYYTGNLINPVSYTHLTLPTSDLV